MTATTSASCRSSGRGGGQNVRDVRYPQGRRSRHHAVDPCSTRSGAPASSAISTTGSSTSPSCSTRRCTSWSAPTPASRRSSSLRGKTVNFSDAGSGTQLSARDVFKRLNIKVKEVNIGQADAYEAMKRNEMAATRPDRKRAGAGDRAAAAGRRLPLPAGAVLEAVAGGLPSGALSHEDYPSLIAAGREHRHHRRRLGDRSPTTGRRAATAIGASSSSSSSSSRSSPNSRSRRVIPNGGRSISPRRFRAGRASTPATNGSTQKPCAAAVGVGSQQDFDRFLARPRRQRAD